jgi:hypothetical protein
MSEWREVQLARLRCKNGWRGGNTPPCRGCPECDADAASRLQEESPKRKPVSERDEKYSVRGRCSNCGWGGNIILPKGERAPGKRDNRLHITAVPAAICKKCGCKTVTAS